MAAKTTPKKKVAKAAAPTARRSDPVLSMRASADFIKRIDKWAKGKGVSRNAAMRQLIEKSLART